MRQLFFILVSVLAALCSLGAHAKKKIRPGSTDKEIKIGNIIPYSMTAIHRADSRVEWSWINLGKAD